MSTAVRAGTLAGFASWAAAAAGAGVWAAAGCGVPALAAAAVLGLVLFGACAPPRVTRGIILLALLLVPDLPSGQSFGLEVHWSAGLTLSNFLLPGLALPLLFGVWLSGRRVLPEHWPGLARWCLALLAWCWLTLLVPWTAGVLNRAQSVTLLAHWTKLALFVVLAVALLEGEVTWHRLAERLLLVGIAANSLVGLAQAAGWLRVFSPLGGDIHGLGVRASGLFYDANMYGVLAAWALLWILCHPAPSSPWRRAGGVLLAVAVAGNLVAAGSRAGYGALAVGGAALWLMGERRAVGRGLLLLGVLAALFPMRSWQRIRGAAETLRADWQSGGVAASRPGADATTQERLASMREAWRQIEQHPWLGLGFGRSLYLGVDAIGDGSPVQAADRHPFQGAQNMELTVLAETGPVGLGLFLAAVAAPVRRRWREAAATGELLLLAGYLGLVAACFTIEALWNARVLMLVVLLTAGSGIGRIIPDRGTAV